MGKRYRKRNWRALIRKWRESGLSKAEFCRENNIELRRFSYHSIKLGAFSRDVRKESASGNGGFAQVLCDEKEASAVQKKESSSLLLRLDFGASIEISEGFNSELLKKVLKSVNELC